MLDNKKIKYICFGLAIIIIILFVSLIFKNLTTKREGYENENPALSNIEELPGKIKGALSNIESSLLLSNNKSNYEDIIIGLNDSVDVQILNIFKKKGESISKDATSKESYETIRKVNELRNLKTVLNESMEYLDSK